MTKLVKISLQIEENYAYLFDVSVQFTNNFAISLSLSLLILIRSSVYYDHASNRAALSGMYYVVFLNKCRKSKHQYFII